MGSIGANKGPAVIFNIDTERIDSMPDYRATQKTQMRDAVEDVQKAINAFMKDSWTTKDIDHLYEALADYFPRSMYDDDAEKIVRTDSAYKIITTVDIRLHENREGKIEATLSPSSYYFDDFSDEQLKNMGIEWRRRR